MTSRRADCDRAIRAHAANGFTLLEVLVVVAVIALLVAILVPGLSAARKEAQRMSCLGNVRAVGHALNLAKGQNGRYPLRDPAPLVPEAIQLDSISQHVAELLVNGSLGQPEALYCPTSLERDKHAKGAYVKVNNGSGVVSRWRTGHISFMYLAGVEIPFETDDGTPTFKPELEAPHLSKNARLVLIGDRVIDLPGPQNLPHSNHGEEGGWFFFTTGDAEWWDKDKLTAHPEPFPRIRIWYFPRMAD